jgi:hypothetical protein
VRTKFYHNQSAIHECTRIHECRCSYSCIRGLYSWTATSQMIRRDIL